MRAPAILLATAVIPLLSGECALSQAHVEHIPPVTVRVVATYHCGAITCWERWVDFEGKRVRLSRACENDKGDVLDISKDR